MGFLARILAPVEFSERCAAAARYAGALSRHTGAELTLLHVLSTPPPEMPAEVFQTYIDERERRLRDFLTSDLTGDSVHRLAVKGDPARKIVQIAHDERADVILMATHGFGPFRRFILGSNTAKVLHDAECPVWTGVHIDDKAAASASLPLQHILCAVDLGPQSRKAIEWAAGLQRCFGARLTLLHAILTVPALPRETGWNTEVREAATRELEKLRRESGADGDLLIEAGEPADVIAAIAGRLPAGVVVIARGSAGGFGRLRAHAYAIIRQSPCPVVSV